MANRLLLGAMAAVWITGAAAQVLAQGNTAAGTAGSAPAPGASASTVGSGAKSVAPGSASGTVGSAGSAAAGGTSASSLGVGASSRTPEQSSNSISVGGSASAPDGRTISRSRAYDGEKLNVGRSANTAVDGRTWSRSVTRTFEYNDKLRSRTRSSSHVPGSRPVRSTSRSTVDLGQ